jgi:hypothetical protein
MTKRAVAEFMVVVLGFTLLTAFIFRPLPWHLSTLVYNPENGDGQFSVWNVAWVARALVRDPLHVLDANIFYPHRWTLAYSELNLFAGAIAVPVYWSTGSAYAAHNFALLASFILSGTGMFYLCRHLTGDRRAAVVGGVAFAFCPHVFAHLPHIQLLQTAGLPFCMLAFQRLLERSTPGRGAQLGLAMALQAYACAYYSVFVLLMVGFSVLTMAWMRGVWNNRAYLTAVGVGAVTALVLSVPLMATALFLRQSGFNRALAGAQQYAATWRAYLASGNLLHAWMLDYLGHWDEVLFPGFIATLFGTAGVIVGWRAGGKRREIAVLYGGLTIAAAWASLGPGAGLYSILYRIVPIFSLMRAPNRFGLVVVFGLSVLAATMIGWLLERSRHATVVGGALIAFALGEAVVPLPFGAALQPHSAYGLLATLPGGPILELPVYSRVLGFRRSRYMLDSTAHWKPLIDGYSDYIPPDFDARAEALADFPSLSSLRDMKRDQVRYAVVHLEPYEGNTRAELEARIRTFAPYLRERFRDREILLFEILGYPE